MHQLCLRLFGVKGIVKKERLVFILNNTRIHLDKVTGLGTYIELEVALTKDNSQEKGLGIAQNLVDELNISDSQLQDWGFSSK